MQTKNCKDKVKVKAAQLCPTLCEPMDFTDHGILQARVLEWVIPSSVDLPDPGIKPGSPALQADSLPTELLGKPCLHLGHTQIIQDISPSQDS